MTTLTPPHSAPAPSGRKGGRRLVGALIAYCSAVSASIAAAAALVSAGLPVDALIAIF